MALGTAKFAPGSTKSTRGHRSALSGADNVETARNENDGPKPALGGQCLQMLSRCSAEKAPADNMYCPSETHRAVLVDYLGALVPSWRGCLLPLATSISLSLSPGS